MDKLRAIIERRDTLGGKLFDSAIQCLIVLSLLAFCVETLPGLTSETRRVLRAIEVATVIVFTAEYLLRLTVAERKLGFVFSFFGLVDLFAILPFYLAVGLDLRSLRIVRLLRLFRALKLVRYSQAIQRCHRAFLIAREELVLFLSAAAMLLFLAAVGIYYFENAAQPEAFSSIFHSLWWAVATLTTVGYGDVYPITVGGRAFTFFVLMIGLGIISVPSGIVASALSEARKEIEQAD